MRHLIAAVLVCATTLPALAQDVSGAQEAGTKFTAALASGDAQTAASYFTDDAVALPPGRAPITGKDNIQRFLGGMTHAVKNLKYVPDEVKALSETSAREVGTFSFKMKSNDVDGKYLLVWTKVGSDWKIAADMWNRNSSGGGKGGKGQGGASKGGNDGE